MLEIESKFKVSNLDIVNTFLNNDSEFISEIIIDDIYFDSINKDLFKTGIFIRIRNGKKLDFKFNLDDIQSKNSDNAHTHCSEFSFNIPLQKEKLGSLNELLKLLNLVEIDKPDFKVFLNNNNLVKSVPVYKMRKTYKTQDFLIAIDHVRDLGEFIEIEHTCPDNSTSQYVSNIQNKMEFISERLQLQLVDTGYNALYWRKYDYEVYLGSPYMLSGDK